MGKIKIAVLISGGGTNLQALIDASNSKTFSGEIALVISNKKEAFGLIRAKNEGIKTIVISMEDYPGKSMREKILLEALNKEKIDLIVLAGYLAIIPDSIIEKYRNRIINIHPSLIPSFSGKGYYGEKVHQEVYMRGVKVTGATVHFVNEETDGGPIILQETTAIDFEDDPAAIQKKVLAIEHRILPQAVKLFAEGKLEVIGNRTKIKDEVKT